MIQTYIVSALEDGLLLKEFIRHRGISNKALKRIKLKGKIESNGVEKTVRYVVKAGDCIILTWPKEEVSMLPYEYPLTIYYEDADYLVLDKPKDMPCIPTRRYPDKTLANAILYYYQCRKINSTVHLVNRLDKDTTGLLVIAKHSQAHYELSKDIKQVQRIYHCLVTGKLRGEGVIDVPILSLNKEMRRSIDERGKRAVTKYKVLKNMDTKTLVECCLETGRTHQIRVHMAHIGHPLVNDAVYGKIEDNEKFHLESVQVCFINPFTNKQIIVRKGYV